MQWRGNSMVVALQMTICNAYSWFEIIVFWLKNSVMIVPYGAIEK